MKVKEACKIAYDCGLETIGEAILNIHIHATNLFPYNELGNELNELCKDAKNYHMDDSVLTTL